MKKLPGRRNKIAFDIVIFFVAIALFGMIYAAFELGIDETAEVTEDMYEFSQQTTDTANDLLSIYTLLPFIIAMLLIVWGIVRAIEGGGKRYV